jgi:hypothetical protein
MINDDLTFIWCKNRRILIVKLDLKILRKFCSTPGHIIKYCGNPECYSLIVFYPIIIELKHVCSEHESQLTIHGQNNNTPFIQASQPLVFAISHIMRPYLDSYVLDLHAYLAHEHHEIPFDKPHKLDDVGVHLLFLIPYLNIVAVGLKS